MKLLFYTCKNKVGWIIMKNKVLFITGSLWRRQSQQSFNTLTPFNFIFHSLHVSAPTGHPQLRYTISYLKDYFNTTDPLQDTCISNIGNTPTMKKGIIPHRKIKERKAHNNCLHKTSNNNRRKAKASTAHSSITTTLMD
jgi:hypothetical protein